MLGVAFISNVYIADSLRARTLINLSAVLYEQVAARTSLPAEVGNIDLNFVPSVAFIPDVYIADSLRARTLINLSTVLLRARTLINLSAVLYKQVSIIDLNFVPGVAFNAMGNVELTGDLLGDADRVNNNNNNAHTVPYSNLKKYLSNSTENNRNNLNIIVTDSTSREFSRVDIKSLTRFKFYKSKNIQLLRPADVTNVFDTVVSKLDEVPTQELSSYIKTELLRDNSCKFYRLIITGEDTHCKQIIKKAYIMLLERALLILFII
ncbi:hypothetical protein HBI80_015780 [Parastagonospora nodorum]|nr:hypothetical protein HBI80_015780 [Parastagonospora nodorum]